MFDMSIDVRHWGGARAGAGRPAKGPHPSEPHRVRPPLSRHHPVLVRARTAQGLAHRLGRRRILQALRRALRLSLGRSDFRIVDLAIRGADLELVVEAQDRIALARGMQGFQVSAARALNRAAARSGNVFVDRYRPAPLVTPALVRAALDRMSTHIAAPETRTLSNATSGTRRTSEIPPYPGAHRSRRSPWP